MAGQRQKTQLEKKEKNRVAVIATKKELKAKALNISQILRDRSIPVEVEVMGRRLAKAIEDADRRNLDYVIIVGERELEEGSVVMRSLQRREQITVKIEKIAEEIWSKA